MILFLEIGSEAMAVAIVAVAVAVVMMTCLNLCNANNLNNNSNNKHNNSGVVLLSCRRRCHIPSIRLSEAEEEVAGIVVVVVV